MSERGVEIGLGNRIRSKKGYWERLDSHSYSGNLTLTFFSEGHGKGAHFWNFQDCCGNPDSLSDDVTGKSVFGYVGDFPVNFPFEFSFSPSLRHCHHLVAWHNEH